ncbi:MAG TPA: CRISPR system precrRNA processing endoribonuclease RAMP protein Cas6, partial [Syntrophorhabdaceae bacterium]|nr:CRISPR system precrRNA processing endoribonuclease RAMP protein Cas6 [Syntrophorhabdaceae bacterium]
LTMTYQIFTFTIEALETLNLPYFKGSTFRGGFGNVFRRVVCVFKHKDCKDCMLKPSCVYAYVFETAPDSDARILNMYKYEKIPHPFIIEPPLETKKIYEKGERVNFNLVLIGRANDYMPYFVYTFEELGKIGIGKGKKPYKLLLVKAENEIIYDSEEKTIKNIPVKKISLDGIWDFENAEEDLEMHIQFTTPVRIKYKRGLTSELPFHVLIRNLLRRILLLYYFHCEKTIPPYDHRLIIHEAEKIKTVKNNLKWWDWERYSNRQKTKMMMGGLVGDITYRGNLKPFLPLLKAGEIIHVGKGTGFGLGKYNIKV